MLHGYGSAGMVDPYHSRQAPDHRQEGGEPKGGEEKDD